METYLNQIYFEYSQQPEICVMLHFLLSFADFLLVTYVIDSTWNYKQWKHDPDNERTIVVSFLQTDHPCWPRWLLEFWRHLVVGVVCVSAGEMKYVRIFIKNISIMVNEDHTWFRSVVFLMYKKFTSNHTLPSRYTLNVKVPNSDDNHFQRSGINVGRILLRIMDFSKGITSSLNHLLCT